MARPAAPKGISKKAAKLWRTVVKEYDLRVDELRVLEDACRELDLIDRLDEQLVDAPLTVKGSMGQTVASPLVQEVRQHRAVLARLLGALKLPDGAEKASTAAPSTSAREAAIARWGRRVS